MCRLVGGLKDDSGYMGCDGSEKKIMTVWWVCGGGINSSFRPGKKTNHGVVERIDSRRQNDDFFLLFSVLYFGSFVFELRSRADLSHDEAKYTRYNL